MTKAQREKAERLMLKAMLDSKPEYKKIMDALIDRPEKNLEDIVKPVIEAELKKARMIGVQIGWQGAMLRAYEMVRDCSSMDEARQKLRDSVDKISKKFGVDSFFDDDGNIIVEEDKE